jgi:dTDP-4-dehydrorhamnose reductase
MTKFLILGGSGMLGSSLISECRIDGIQYDAPDSSILDIRNQRQVQDYISKLKPTAIVNCAAWTDVENSENEYQSAYELNVNGIQNVAIAAQDVGVPVVHISTDYVFDGLKKAKYSEQDETSPINSYGLSKLLGENALLKLCPEKSYIIRTSWLYGMSGKNFVKSILKKALEGKRMQVVQDQVGSPTNSEDLARGIISILQVKPSPGIYHFSNLGDVSWYEFARKIYEMSGFDVQCIEPIASTAFPSKAKRPEHSVLSTDKWSTAKITKIIAWEESLSQILPRILDSVRTGV